MPTFLVIKSSSVVDTLRGANPSALTAAVRKAANDAASTPGGAPGAIFQTRGRKLGSASDPSGAVVDESGLAGLQRRLVGSGGLVDGVVRFVALYVISLLSFDAFKAAEESAFTVRAGR